MCDSETKNVLETTSAEEAVPDVKRKLEERIETLLSNRRSCKHMENVDFALEEAIKSSAMKKLMLNGSPSLTFLIPSVFNVAMESSMIE